MTMTGRDYDRGGTMTEEGLRQRRDYDRGGTTTGTIRCQHKKVFLHVLVISPTDTLPVLFLVHLLIMEDVMSVCESPSFHVLP